MQNLKKQKTKCLSAIALSVACLLVFTQAAFAKTASNNKIVTNPVSMDIFTDENFRAYAKNSLHLDQDNDGYFTLEEITAVTEINIAGNKEQNNFVEYDKPVYSLEGIEYFPNLEKINANYQYLTDIILLKNSNLVSLSIEGTDISSLDLSACTNLKYLNISKTKIQTLNTESASNLLELNAYAASALTNIDVTKNVRLERLDIGYSLVSTVNVSQNPLLDFLDIGALHLSSIDITKNPALTFIRAYQNDIKTLDISNNTKLKWIDVNDSAYLESFDVIHLADLRELHIRDTLITSLDLSQNLKLEALNMDSMQLSAIDLSHNTELVTLWAGNGNLNSLDVSKNLKLKTLWAEKNHIPWINLEQNTALTTSVLHEQALDNKALQQVSISPNGIYSLNMAPLLNGGDISKVTFNDNRIQYNSNGMLSFTDPTLLNTEIAYLYDAGNNNVLQAYFKLYAPTQNISMDVFTNANFKWYAKNKLGLDKDNDGYATQEELDAVKNIDISYDVFPNYVTSLDGIEYFSNLETLAARRQPYTSLNVSKNSLLKELDASKSALGSLNVDNNTALEAINVEYTGLTGLNLSQNINLKSAKLTQSLYNRETQTPWLDGGYGLNIPLGEGLDTSKIFFEDSRIRVNAGDIFFTDTSILNSNITYQYNTGSAFAMDVSLYIYGTDVPMSTFTNANFRWYLKNKKGLDADNDGIATSEELLAIKDIDVSYDVFPHYITSLDGIESLANLETLVARRQPYTNINIIDNTRLKVLDASFSALNQLFFYNTNDALETLNVEYTGLSSLALEYNNNLSTTLLDQAWYKEDLQTPTVVEGVYTLNLSLILKSNNGSLSKVSFADSRISYNPDTGVLSFTDPSILNSNIIYQYNTGKTPMNVSVHIYNVA